jgi:hypothetical protein
LPLRLLAERTGLSSAMARRRLTRSMTGARVLIDMVLTQILGGEAIRDFVRHEVACWE